MNSYDRVMMRLKGREVDRAPNFNILMAYAANLIHQPLSAYYTDYRVLVEANLAVLQQCGLDLVQAISDPYREAADFGLKVEYPPNDLPAARMPLLQEPGDLERLIAPVPEDGARMQDRLAAVRLFREQVGGEVPIMGWVEGALAEAADLRGVAILLQDLILRPEWVEELLEICVQVEIQFALAQLSAGADLIGIGDAVASQISPRMYRRFALPYEQRIIQAIHEHGGIARLHICGNTTRILTDMVASGADIIDLDWMVDMPAAVENFGGQVSFCGNMDPVAVMLQGSPRQVYEATQNCLKTGGNRCIVAAGCEIPPGTPLENLLEQSRAIREFSA